MLSQLYGVYVALMPWSGLLNLQKVFSVAECTTQLDRSRNAILLGWSRSYRTG